MRESFDVGHVRSSLVLRRRPRVAMGCVIALAFAVDCGATSSVGAGAPDGLEENDAGPANPDTLDDGAAPTEGSEDSGSRGPDAGLPTVLGGPAVVLGEAHACALLDDHSVKCWGSNGYGQIGVGDAEDRGDEPNEMGDALPSVNLGTGRTAIGIAAGHFHTCALLDDHTVKCWGYNLYGQLGLGDKASRGRKPSEMGDALPTVSLGTGRTAVALTAGHFHTCALLDDHSVKCWGDNYDVGVLGVGDLADRGDGPNEMGNTLPKVDLGKGHTAVGLVAGSTHTCALLDDHSVKCWGNNRNGELGLGDWAPRGRGPNEMGDALPAVDLGQGHTAIGLAAGYDYSCALLDDRSVKCWGDNRSGALGLGDTSDRGDGPSEMGKALPAVELGKGRTAVSLAAGGNFTCALLDDHSTKCWGDELNGQIGLGGQFARGDAPGEMGEALPTIKLGTGRTAVRLTTGYAHRCAQLDDQSVKCWGRNDHGELGLGDTKGRNESSEMGNALPAIDLGTGRLVLKH